MTPIATPLPMNQIISSVPTLTEWGLIAMAGILLIVGACWVLHKHFSSQ
jgi:hypothetical protein